MLPRSSGFGNRLFQDGTVADFPQRGADPCDPRRARHQGGAGNRAARARRPCQHDGVNQDRPGHLRRARPDDADQLLSLWDLLFADTDPTTAPAWKEHAHDWFAHHVDDSTSTRLPVIDVQGSIVATAIGTVELGVPNPHCPRGRAVRLANVITVPGHRGRGYATELIRDVIRWAETVGADRVDLSATPDGQRIYEQLGFTGTSAPRMKLVL